MIDNALIDAIVAIGNQKKVVKTCEPNIMESLPLEKWMVVRSLVAAELLANEYKLVKEKIE